MNYLFEFHWRKLRKRQNAGDKSSEPEIIDRLNKLNFVTSH